MTASELKQEYQARDNGYYFDRSPMKFFGDTMSNYGCRKTTINTYSENDVAVYELYRKRPVKHGFIGSSYFRQDNFTGVRRKED